MRTIKRVSLQLNPGKLLQLKDLSESYAREKQHWLIEFQKPENLTYAKRLRGVRDRYFSNTAQYTSNYGLQKRQCRTALEDAAATMDRYWQAQFTKVIRLIHSRIDWDLDTKRETCKKLRYENLANLLHGQSDKYLRRVLKRVKGEYPSVKSRRSLWLEEGPGYRVFKGNGRQYIKIATKDRGKRLVIPLMGNTPIRGMIRVVLKGDHIEVHYTATVKPSRPNEGVIEAIDKGYTEAFVDSEGKAYGPGLGELITQKTERIDSRMRKRHRVHAGEKKLRESDPVRAKRIRKNNLGRKKLNRQLTQAHSTIERKINEGLNQLFRSKAPQILITEGLTGSFPFNNGKKLNRKFSAWIKGLIADRVEFKALVGGSRHEIVNPAYSSQRCPACGYVDSKNRKFDSFECLHCGYVDHADRVGALNLISRWGDSEITRWTPYWKVKSILMDRFHRRVETSKEGTDPAWTLDTVPPPSPQGGGLQVGRLS